MSVAWWMTSSDFLSNVLDMLKGTPPLPCAFPPNTVCVSSSDWSYYMKTYYNGQRALGCIKTYISASSFFEVCDADRLVQNIVIVGVQAFRLMDRKIFTFVEQVELSSCRVEMSILNNFRLEFDFLAHNLFLLHSMLLLLNLHVLDRWLRFVHFLDDFLSISEWPAHFDGHRCRLAIFPLWLRHGNTGAKVRRSGLILDWLRTFSIGSLKREVWPRNSLFLRWWVLSLRRLLLTARFYRHPAVTLLQWLKLLLDRGKFELSLIYGLLLVMHVLLC